MRKGPDSQSREVAVEEADPESVSKNARVELQGLQQREASMPRDIAFSQRSRHCRAVT